MKEITGKSCCRKVLIKTNAYTDLELLNGCANCQDDYESTCAHYLSVEQAQINIRRGRINFMLNS